ncbi:uncharacterized protein CC84DRAFT_1240691 [Paraphaeosphaeria sporulosa]|uniref:Uncharacterized protein n=1 Tax=Paraphaeosphaeria sporulosa TaxID=1460663 RepID=A0A177CQC0_9PLEO|nr:uncharacterized protein CC84DRAFT_1240691 [Paraphaeosphaeria sporulosa]OAG08947.1 hypothetical protein CC84DRAFT_1240691 [Paraphaeosphaeria sporulosa]
MRQGRVGACNGNVPYNSEAALAPLPRNEKTKRPPTRRSPESIRERCAKDQLSAVSQEWTLHSNWNGKEAEASADRVWSCSTALVNTYALMLEREEAATMRSSERRPGHDRAERQRPAPTSSSYFKSVSNYFRHNWSKMTTSEAEGQERSSAGHDGGRTAAKPLQAQRLLRALPSAARVAASRASPGRCLRTSNLAWNMANFAHARVRHSRRGCSVRLSRGS